MLKSYIYKIAGGLKVTLDKNVSYNDMTIKHCTFVLYITVVFFEEFTV